jgi:hypothetical protein
MSLFRSEESHLARWLASTTFDRGAVLPLSQVWTLAQAWYSDPRAPTWKGRSVDEAQDVLDSVGLTGEFWRLKG